MSTHLNIYSKINLFFKKILKYLFFIIFSLVVLFFVSTFLLWLFKTPSNDRDWEFGQQKLQKVFFSNDKVIIKNLRDYDWTKIGKEEKYIDLEFNLGDLKSIEVGESHFSEIEGIGHIFLIFNLNGNKDIALSIEIDSPKLQGSISLKGLKFDYELIYILATKEDLLSLRKKRNERVYIYPIKISEEKTQELFKLISQKVNRLYENPEFYHLFFKNCTNLIIDEVEKISDKKFPFYEQTFAPGYAGEVLFEMNILDVNNNLKDFSELRKKYLVSF